MKCMVIYQYPTCDMRFGIIIERCVDYLIFCRNSDKISFFNSAERQVRLLSKKKKDLNRIFTYVFSGACDFPEGILNRFAKNL